MPVTVVRFNLVEPGATPASLSARYRAALDMAAYADEHGITTVQTEEHHGVDNNWLPSPFAFAGAVFGATRRIAVTVSAVIGPLHDPLRLAEEIAVLDLLSGGRLVTVAGIGYRPEEYALFDVEWRRRGRIQDELLETLLKAWTGEEFEYRGRTVRITPRPLTDPHPLLLVGGSSKAAARRAARLGLPFFPSAHLPELEAYYKERLVEYGTEGWTMMPTAETPLLHIAEDPDRTWAAYGGHFLHEAQTYASWQSGDIRSAVRSAATSVDELREEGVYRILTPDQCVELGLDNLVLHPLAGGMPVEEGWRSLRLFAERVIPALGG
ncbi:alkanesulfonate monooxygenase SsuD/methylene tetrahydromethanopterin reductase-like flavin-dependent oxidoreductase (luciferase family) [Streptomyces sp. SAI-135]|uniref:LLM class flavin-dependent oxidoreductase n=1 Tax=unclassified Streptomyces TaxID=2593676 RepID=UPI002473F39B|nr:MULTISPECIES: LLM class flavin-dependent oxidoreductase [unclassified Streptomyces]MDH6516230.1 alkanesulfonate monooxygenase SsuD/methylene tetrahydromethanopterin reductase-like flavin-dependent oxidoreductase (luciferase family) [Streptomyces sp. SAI-090]MDH6548428.1 alkanesulfonate monooxygenase SsuD/methylene tetrahydromethanopterin reductase-like flavin-dependent oxidoreductase (luciferase family) [Streptomyces sp. SAI-041]MDH6567520.1 alkanesulfonate monooxygenase SsuD/methylene tetrah